MKAVFFCSSVYTLFKRWEESPKPFSVFFSVFFFSNCFQNLISSTKITAACVVYWISCIHYRNDIYHDKFVFLCRNMFVYNYFFFFSHTTYARLFNKLFQHSSPQVSLLCNHCHILRVMAKVMFLIS